MSDAPRAHSPVGRLVPLGRTQSSQNAGILHCGSSAVSGIHFLSIAIRTMLAARARLTQKRLYMQIDRFEPLVSLSSTVRSPPVPSQVELLAAVESFEMVDDAGQKRSGPLPGVFDQDPQPTPFRHD